MCLWFQVSPVHYLGNGPCGDEDASLFEEESPGGAEIQEAEEECTRFNRTQERRKYVGFIQIKSLDIMLMKARLRNIDIFNVTLVVRVKCV